MKFLLVVLLAATAAKFTVSTKQFTQFDLAIYQKYQNREPPLGKNAKRTANAFVATKWIEQRLDNFNPQDQRRWNMRYMENSVYHHPGGPIFIFIGGEWPITSGWLLSGHMHDMARQLNGTLYITEHRYYGSSRPTADLTTANLRFLTVDQALADLAHFIVSIKQNNTALRESGVILVGASYAATLATLFMQKYPHLANGAWASSAPLEAKVDLVEYKEVVSEAMIDFGGPSCSNRIRRAFEELEDLVASGNTSRVEQVFRLCFPLNLSNSLDVWNFFFGVAGPFSWLVLFHNEISRNIQIECERLMNIETENHMEALSIWWHGGPTAPNDPDPPCYNHYYLSFLSWYTGTSWESASAVNSYRQWLYQTCSEFGWFQSSGSEKILFGSHFPVNMSLAICVDVFGENFTPQMIQSNVDKTNTQYGGKKPNAPNVYSTHGKYDPWRPAGVQVDINESSPTVIFPLATHCSDLYSISQLDPPEVLASKERIFQLVQLWLQRKL